ncbi:MAG: restriction endonuclease subunit S [Chloroflexi bacterium HGW-Chloroflexi-9]|nr:MAG: restriction endonuclease subunit S [Chloroflexi bacterium HGW-Chloroflexi-9]
MITALSLYPAYRDSGVPWLGEVPEHWEVLPALAAYKPKLVRNTGMIESTVLSLSYGRLIVRPPEKLRGLVPESFETYQLVDPGDIIVRTTDLQNDQTSLRVGFARHRGIITSAYLCLSTTERMSPEFGYQFLNTYDLLKIIYGYGSGLRQNLSFAEIKRMPVLVPPPEEQAAIVRFLDYADRRIRRYVQAKQRLIALLEEQKQAIIHRAVTRGLDPDVPLKPSGMEWLGDIPEHWEVRSFLRCVVERADYRGATPTKRDDGVILVTARNIRRGWIDYETSREFVAHEDYAKIMRRGLPRLDDLLLTMEAPLGHVALVNRTDIALAQRVVRFRVDPDVLMPRFALLAMLSPYFQGQLLVRGTGSTATGIKASKLPQIQVVLPPLAEQRQVLDSIDLSTEPIEKARSRAEREIAFLREYRIRLIADVVTGKLEVRDVAARLPEETDEPEPLDDFDLPADELDELDGEEAGAELAEAVT